MASDALVIVICTYNNAPLLERTLAALEEQQVAPGLGWSVLVVDNNCTDETPAVVARYAARGRIPRLSRVGEPRQGLTCARQRGVASSDASVIAFVDDDCLLTPRWVEQAVAFFAAHPAAGAVGGKVIPHWEVPPTPDALRQQAGYACLDYGDEAKRMPMRGHVHLVGAGMAARREAILQCGWMEKTYLLDRKGKQLTSGGDMELMLRIRLAGFELWYNPAMELRHIIPPERMHPDYLCRLYRGFAEGDAILCALTEGPPVSLAWKLRLVASRLGFLLRRLLAYVVKDFLLRRRIGAFRRIQVHEGLGQFHSALRLLWHKEL